MLRVARLLASGIGVCLVAACSDGAGQGSDDGVTPRADGGFADRVDSGDNERACPLPADPPAKQAFFTTRYPDPDLTIEDQVVSLIDSTPDDGRIRIAVFTWTRRSISNALINAAGRGVDVAVVVDESNQSEDPPGSGTYQFHQPIRDLIAGLGPDRVIVCDDDSPPDGGACIGSNINHNKFGLFSSLCDGSQDVVIQSSANYTAVQRRLRNNMVVIRGDAALYQAYDEYWSDLAGRQRDPSYYRSSVGDDGTKAYFYPRASGTDGSLNPATDTIHNILQDNVECGQGATVRVAMAYFTAGRSYLVDDLDTVQARGCDVKVIASGNNTSPEVESKLIDLLGAGNVRIVDGVHSKYLLVSGQYLGEKRDIVWTGSHNYTVNALRNNDETLLKITDSAIHADYAADWQDMWQSLPDASSE